MMPWDNLVTPAHLQIQILDGEPAIKRQRTRENTQGQEADDNEEIAISSNVSIYIGRSGDANYGIDHNPHLSKLWYRWDLMHLHIDKQCESTRGRQLSVVQQEQKRLEIMKQVAMLSPKPIPDPVLFFIRHMFGRCQSAKKNVNG